MLQINSMPDHIHIFVGMRPHQSIAELMKNVKVESSKWIKQQGPAMKNFAWQEGYGAFSYAKSQVGDVVRYIKNQQVHHQKEDFLTEYRKILDAFDVDWDEQYLFKEPE